MQSKIMSMVEAAINTVLGVVVSFYVAKVMYPIYGIHVSDEANWIMMTIFMIVALFRSYVLRRIFEWLERKGNSHEIKVT